MFSNSLSTNRSSNIPLLNFQHVVKAPIAGQIHGLHVAAGQQVSDGSILFSVKVSYLPLELFHGLY